MVYQYQHGFCIMQAQPFHIGHDRLIKKMMAECALGTVLIGSAQECGTEKNPLPYFVRKKMIQNVWRKNEAYSRLMIVGIKDITNYPLNLFVMETIQKELPNRPKPDIIYVGDEKEYLFFKNDVKNVGVCSRTTQDFPFLSGSMVMKEEWISLIAGLILSQKIRENLGVVFPWFGSCGDSRDKPIN